MNLEEYINSLPQKQQYQLAIRFIEFTLPIWEKYAQQEGSCLYMDSIVGMEHLVDKALLQDTTQRVKYLLDNPHSSTDSTLSNLYNQFSDPIVALQDWDWELPNDVQKTFYAVYNLVEAFIGQERSVFNELTIYVSINQAIDAILTAKIMNWDEINQILTQKS